MFPHSMFSIFCQFFLHEAKASFGISEFSFCQVTLEQIFVELVKREEMQEEMERFGALTQVQQPPNPANPPAQ